MFFVNKVNIVKFSKTIDIILTLWYNVNVNLSLKIRVDSLT